MKGSDMPSIFPIAYLPPISYLSMLLRSSDPLLEHHEHFVKKSIRNRCTILGANGPILLSVPVNHDDRWRKPICEISIALDEEWKRSHWKSIESAYSHAPYFEFYQDSLAETLFASHTTLVSLNNSLLQLILRWLKQDRDLEITAGFTPYKNQPHDYRTYWDSRLEGLKMEKTYKQVFSDRHGFISDPSIIDLIFNTGPDALAYL
jgi:hypothetical protein